MWINSKHTYRDGEGNELHVSSTEERGVVIESKEGIFFETEDECLVFLDKLKNKVETLFEEN